MAKIRRGLNSKSLHTNKLPLLSTNSASLFTQTRSFFSLQTQCLRARARARRSMAFAFFVLVVILVALHLHLLVRPRPAAIPLLNRHVLISGGSTGLGRAHAAHSASAGARVTILTADVRDASAVAAAVEEAGPVDVLICSHGVFAPKELEAQDLEEVKLTMEVNIVGTFNLIRAALPGMKRRAMETGVPASVAIVSSQAGQVGIYGYTAYSASKFALRGLAEALQHEVYADNIRVTLIFPPDMETPGHRGSVIEHKMRAEITNVITGSSSGMSAEGVAKKALNGIQSGKFIVPCNFDGTMLCIATAGLSPQPSSLTAFIEVFGAGFMRFVALCLQWNWFSIIENYHGKEKRKYPRKMH